MSSEISKQDYLKRYLGNKDSDRKRKKKPNASASRLKIVDENIDLKCINFGEKVVEDADEAPVIAEVIDERPLEVKLKELYDSSRWKKIDSNENSQCDSSLSGKIYPCTNKDSNHSPLTQMLNSSKSKGNHFKRSKDDSDKDISPPRHQTQRVSRSRHDSNSDVSPPRKPKQSSIKRHDSDIDVSPPRSSKQNTSKRRNSDSDISPPRRNCSTAKSRQPSSDISPPRKLSKSVFRSRNDSDSDMSPPRHQNRTKSAKQLKNTLDRHDSDSGDKSKRFKKDKNSDSDLSPPRTLKSMKPRKTLSGLKAGLQNAETLKKETQELRKRERAHINMLDDDVSGRNADTVVRDRKTGLKRNLDQEKKMIDEENKKAEEHQQKYEQWGKGIEQGQNKMDKFAEDLYEMSKPLQRYRDDKDLDDRLKSIVHDEDPMAEYIKKKKQKNTPSVPAYSGPPAPPNRFGIQPGYRWDGVDRSNGFEKKFFEKINSKKSIEETSYLWSVQDM